VVSSFTASRRFCRVLKVLMGNSVAREHSEGVLFLMSSKNNKAVISILNRLKLAAHRELGPDAAKRFVRAADTLAREFETKPRNDERLRAAIDDLLIRLLKADANEGK
jgi:hypothetical protein